ncbi:MAG: UDP-N-acetylmuramoyl-L-alanyl-D-glutamate--2,6-diaminopimelate ligase [Candidatus Magnetoovum sp. WYHC-5]|nr:UDP-N-acetylmuramoyl-L-alanyl-D-glutamate--2,6-diaminopimelate ligase [Candidatus Magnetoovum sp. WYHC-5]
MDIRELLNKINVIEVKGNLDIKITSVTYDSRNVVDGSMFFALIGVNIDGHKYIKDAVNRGATAVVYDEWIDTVSLPEDILFIRVDDSRYALACLSSAFYGEPSQSLKLVGITGTNGKTTTSYLIKSIIEAYGKSVGLTGTIQYMIGSRVYKASHTTPESTEYQKFLREAVDEGVEYVVSEVSSHALSQRRVDGASFDVALFTNISRDHLDYHIDMENYFLAKLRLFRELVKYGGTCIINMDDEYANRIIENLNCRYITYGIENDAHIMATNISKDLGRLDFTINCEGKPIGITSNLRGYVNVYNILAAFAAGVSLSLPQEVIVNGIAQLEGVRGRFEPLEAGQDFSVLIDYAHTDDALKNVLQSIRKVHTTGKIITVFGCGGNRDKGKRPLMGKVVSSLSDVSIITSDNPRNEEPADIIKDIVPGLTGDYIIEEDRKKAIETAVYMAKEGDVVLIAGKGHEDYQEIKAVRYEFDDYKVAKGYIKRLLAEKKSELRELESKINSVYYN